MARSHGHRTDPAGGCKAKGPRIYGGTGCRVSPPGTECAGCSWRRGARRQIYVALCSSVTQTSCPPLRPLLLLWASVSLSTPSLSSVSLPPKGGRSSVCTLVSPVQPCSGWTGKGKHGLLFQRGQQDSETAGGGSETRGFNIFKIRVCNVTFFLHATSSRLSSWHAF